MIQKVPFLDLSRHHEAIRGEVLEEWAEIFDTNGFVSGPRVALFENAFAAAHGAGQAVAVSSGTAALEIALRALDIREGAGVVVPASTFIATAEAVSNVGARPVFVDCDPSGNIDVDQAVAALTDPSVRGILPVHLYGHPADVDPILEAAGARGIPVIEDAAQAHLARYKDRPVGSLGTAAAFSFYPGKNLGAPGEGGAVTTNDEDLAATMRSLRDHGQAQKYTSNLVGTNARMMELVAAMLEIKLRTLDEATDGRRRVAARYQELLGYHPLIDLPQEAPWARPVYHLYVIEVDDRDRVQALLSERGISSGLHYPVPLHLQPAYGDLEYDAGDFPVAERRAGRLLSLPMFPELTDEEVDAVAAALIAAVEEINADA